MKLQSAPSIETVDEVLVDVRDKPQTLRRILDPETYYCQTEATPGMPVCRKLQVPLEAVAPNDRANSSTQGINDSIILQHTIVFWGDRKRFNSSGALKIGRTSQFSRMN